MPGAPAFEQRVVARERRERLLGERLRRARPSIDSANAGDAAARRRSSSDAAGLDVRAQRLDARRRVSVYAAVPVRWREARRGVGGAESR